MKIIVGRFQAPVLTGGHKGIIENCIKDGQSLCIFIGETKHSERNFHDPLSFEYRKRLIKEFVDDLIERNPKNNWGELWVFMIRDIGNVELWNKDLDERIDAIIELGIIKEDEDITLVGSRRSFLETYNGKFKTKYLQPLTNTSYQSATEYRESILNIAEEEITEEMANGIVWAYGQQERKKTSTDSEALS